MSKYYTEVHTQLVGRCDYLSEGLFLVFVITHSFRFAARCIDKAGLGSSFTVSLRRGRGIRGSRLKSHNSLYNQTWTVFRPTSLGCLK